MPKISKIKDNIVTIKGNYKYKQEQYFQLSSNSKGFVLSATADEAQLLVIGNPSELKMNTDVTPTKDTSAVEVHEHYFGKIITPIGEVVHPVNNDSQSKLFGTGDLDSKTPSILDRVPLNRPLNTGLLVVDTMIPIGKGQRELIIGDRNTGKTTIALNAIINQKDKKTKVIYVAIGQKRNSVIQSYNILKENDSMDDSIIIFANPDSSAEQFLAPNIGMAMAEAIAYKGYDVLIVFDDLTKHANVYREVSLSIGRNPGREAYPTDIFYQHSSLLERAGSFNKKYNNGTITALPIVETVQGDIASLIPSNVISITDGQIFTSHDMFNNGEYPAIDVQLSVSRTGSSVQSKMIKRISKSMKAEHAKLFEIKKFAEMSIDVSDDLSKKIEQWNGLNNILLQFGYVGYSKEMIVVLIEMFKAGAMGRLISPRDFSLVIQNFMLEDEVGKIIASKINSGKITKVELKKAIEEIFTPLALAASGEEGTLFSAKEVEAMKGGL